MAQDKNNDHIKGVLGSIRVYASEIEHNAKEASEEGSLAALSEKVKLIYDDATMLRSEAGELLRTLKKG